MDQDTQTKSSELSFKEKFMVWLNSDEENILDLSHQDLSSLDLTGVDFSNFRLRLRNTNFNNSCLKKANFSTCILDFTSFNKADLENIVLKFSNTCHGDFSEAKNFPQQSDLLSNLKETKEGYLCYKYFGDTEFERPKKWQIKQGNIIQENVNHNRNNLNGCGISACSKVGMTYCKNVLEYKQDKWWICLIEWKALSTLCVPYNNRGTFRVGKLKLLDQYRTPMLSKEEG